jgi:hypothetical protein
MEGFVVQTARIAIALSALGGLIWAIWVCVLCQQFLTLAARGDRSVKIKVRWLSSIQIESLSATQVEHTGPCGR